MIQNIKVYTVTEINLHIKEMFSREDSLRFVYVKGEVANLKYHSSNHIYFSLKDDDAVISCTMYSFNRKKGLDFRLENGQQIICFGKINVYEKNGTYSMYAEKIVLDGMGALYERFEQLKIKLEATGMFDAIYKKPIPQYAQTIGIVTAPEGAGLQDIIKISKRRNPYVQLILCPAKVEGDGAAETIVSGIRALDRLGLDVIIVGRGGGPEERMWAFNEEIVARAIFECSTPVVSAVGHEINTTISDFVADLRAQTPSAAAELTVFKYDDYKDKLYDIRKGLSDNIAATLKYKKDRLEHAQSFVKMLRPEYMLEQKQIEYARCKERLCDLMDDILHRKNAQYENYISVLKAMSPLEKLSKGYAYAKANGKSLTSVGALNVGDDIDLYLRDGNVKTKVTGIEQADYNNKLN